MIGSNGIVGIPTQRQEQESAIRITIQVPMKPLN